jgi:hypothetical protein
MDAHPPSRLSGAGAGSKDDAEPVPPQPVPGLRQDADAEDGTEADAAGREATFTAPEGYELL